MRAGCGKLLVFGSPLLFTLLFQSVNISAYSSENMRSQDPLASFPATAVLLNDQLETPTVSVPAPSPASDEDLGGNSSSALPNFSQVSESLYRSGQPTQAGVDRIKNTGIKTILKLNNDDPAESKWAKSAGLGFETLVMSNQTSPTYEQIDQALAIINDSSKQPVLVHCHLGHDRTGAVVGAYRVTVQGWSIDKAAAEAKSLGYSSPNFQDITTYLQGYVAHAHQQSSISAALDRGAVQPDWNVTPGRLCASNDPNFKEYRYPEHIAYCNRNVTKQMKQQIAADYGNIPQSEWPNYEFDHLIPLGIGGNSSIENVWPQPRGSDESDGKDKLENELYNELASGTITQKAAVQAMYDWFNRYAARHTELSETMRVKLSTLGS